MIIFCGEGNTHEASFRRRQQSSHQSSHGGGDEAGTPLPACRAHALPTRSLVDDVLDEQVGACLLYTSPSPRDATLSRMPSSA